MRILIIDDRPDEITWLTDHLHEHHRCEIDIVSTEIEARGVLEQIAAAPDRLGYVLVIVDIMIPVAKIKDLLTLDEKMLQDSRNSGLRLCAFIREQLQLSEAELPVVAMSTRGDDEVIRETRRFGVRLFSRHEKNIRTDFSQILASLDTPAGSARLEPGFTPA